MIAGREQPIDQPPHFAPRDVVERDLDAIGFRQLERDLGVSRVQRIVREAVDEVDVGSDRARIGCVQTATREAQSLDVADRSEDIGERRIAEVLPPPRVRVEPAGE